MDIAVGTVQNLNGKFFAKDASGNITELKNGDTIMQGMTVVGDKSNPNSASIEIAMDADKNVISLHGTQEQLFDASTVQDASMFADALATDSIENVLNSDLYAPDDAISDDNADNKDSVDDQDTTAGEEKVKEEDGGSAQFSARDGNIVDVNSDLRDAKFKFRSHTFELKSIFGNEDGHRLSPISHDNIYQPTISVVPPRPTSTPIPVELPKTPTPTTPEPTMPPTQTTPTVPEPVLVTLKLFAIDSNGNEVLANGANEGETVSYIVRAFSGDTEITTFNGSVNIIFNNSTATGSDNQTLSDGTQDFDNTTQTVTIGQQFNTTLFDDYVVDHGEIFTLNIKDGSYTGSSSGYTVVYDTTPVTTTINDNPAKVEQPTDENNIDNPTIGSYDSTDTVYAVITDNTSVNEGSAGTYTVQLLDKDGNPVRVSVDTNVTVKYTNITTQDGDTQYNNNATITVTIPANGSSNTFNVDTIDDYIADNGEQFKLEVTNIATTEFENVNIQGYTDTNNVVHVNNVTTTISDAGSGTNKVYAVITGDVSVNEGSAGTYTVQLLDKDGNPVTVTVDTDVTVKYTNTTTQDGDTQYNNNATIIVTIPANGSSNTFNVNTIDDYIADNGEQFKLEVTNVATTEFEAVNTQGYTDTNNVVHVNNVSTTILDNSQPNTPNDPADDTVELDKEIVLIKLFAVDEDGNVITDGSGNYQLANSADEVPSSVAKYVAYAFNDGETTFNDSTKLDTQVGQVNVEFTDGTATGINASTPSVTDGSEDYNITAQTIHIGEVFGTDVFKDTLDDGGETYTVKLVDSTYASYNGESYESVNIDTNPVTTTIKERLYAQIEQVDNVANESEQLTYKITIVDELGNPITVTSDAIVHLDYTGYGANPASSNDYTPQSTVTVANGNSSNTFTIDTTDDYFAEGDEQLKITISEIIYNNNNFSIKPYTIANSMSTDKDSELGTIKDNPANVEQPDNSVNPDDPTNGSYDANDTVYVKITHDDSVYEGNTLTHTVSLVDKDGHAVTVPTGETITVTLTYAPDTTENADFKDATRTTTVTITGGNSSVAVDNITIDDFVANENGDGSNEVYTVTVTAVSQANGTYENVAIDTANNSVTGEIIDGVSLGVPTNAGVDEDDFDMATNVTTITDTQSLNITAPNGDNAYNLLFDGTPTFTSDDGTFNTADGDSLTSDGTVIEYVVSGDTTTAYVGSGRTTNDKVFEITLNKHNAGGADDDYTYTQYKNIDHPLANVDDNIVLTFGYKITDQGQTSNIQNFTVTVNDSLPSGAAQNITLNEDSSKTIYISDESFAGGNITLNNGDGDVVVSNGNHINIYDNTTDKNVVGTLTNNGDGTLTFNPSANFSGATAGFTYGVSDGDGDTATATIDITVNPIADTPDMNGTSTSNGLNESTIKTTPQVLEDNNNEAGVEGGAAYTATVGLILPQITDATDLTAANSNDDQAEKLGLITLKSSTGETITAGGSDYVVDSTGITIFINDIPNYHYNGITALDADVSLTQAEFEAIVVKFENENAVNPKFTVSVDEYEVNDDNTLKAIASANNTQSYEVDILAVTDPITLAWDANGGLGTISTTTNANDTFTFTTVNEGVSVIDLKSLLTKTSGLETDPHGDLDGSEHRSYTISGIPEGTIITLGTKSVAAGSDGIATINFPDNTVDDPDFTMTINEQYSGTLSGTITLNVTDTDSDSTGTINTQSASVDFTMTINPVADQVTLKVAQARGDEDAGRTNSNDENVSADTIDAPQNGIELNINVISDDNQDIGPNPVNPKETYNVTIDGIPDGGSLYVYDNSTSSWKLVDETSSNSGNIAIDATAVGTYAVTITDYQNDHLTKFIPPYNSDADYTFDITAYSMDNGASGIALAQTLQIAVTVDGVADVPVNDGLATTTATDDASHSNSFNLVSTEDNGSINLKNIFSTPATLDSNDNDGSETLTFKLTGLADGFGINGATYIGGSGTGRVWLVDLTELNNDHVTLTTPTHYAGEVDFKVQFVTTENSGDSKTHDVKDISLMVTPVAETTATVNSSDTQNEDETKALNFGFSTPDTDGASAGHESLQSFSIDMSTVPAGVILTGSVSGVLSGSGYVALDVTNGVLETVTATLPQDSDTDYSFNISYTYQDVAVDGQGNTYTDTVTKTDQLYSVTVNAITDDINLAMATTATDAGITDNAGHVTVTANGTFTKTLTVTGIDSDGRGSPDTDGSEMFTRVTVSGVPEGITVGGANGTYAGDTGGGNYSGYWYVDVPNDAIDPSGTYNLVFDVDGSFNPADLGDYPITVTAYSEDAGNGVEQSDAQSFTLTIDNAIAGPGPGTPATITQFYQDIDNDGTHDHAYLVSTTTDTTITDANAYEGSVLREDTQFQLSDVVHVETDITGASSQAFSITLKNVPAGVTVEGMTLNANGFYTLSGSGNQAAIVAKLQSILITPALNQNTDAADISNTDLAFDIELTTYAAGGASNTALINFSGSVLPVTDEMNLSVVNGGQNTEDVDQTFSITLGEGNDGAKTALVDGKVYIKITEAYTDTQGADGASGVLKDGSGVAIVTTEVNPAGLAAGTYYVISGVSINDTLDFIYTPATNRNGTVTVDTYVKNIESETWTTYTPAEMASHQTFSFDVNAVTDGFALTSGTASGNEDGMIALNIVLTSNDSSEQISSVSISDVPDGFLLYYGANAGSAVLAQNLGTTGATTSIEMTYGNPENVDVNTWNIPLSAGALPAYIGLKAPENWSGTVPTITINSVDMDGNSSSDTLDITIDPVVDTLTLNTTKTFGNEGSDILLNLNANVQDLDGSETVKLELTGLGAGASFKADGIEIDAADINYAGDTYTITNIAASDINSLSFVQSHMNGNVSVNAYMVESDGSTSGVVAGADFNVNIATVTPTGGNDALFYSGSPIDGGNGIDTVSIKSGVTLDFTKLDNIEKIDLTANGDHTITGLTLQDVVDMTDSNNTLEIIGDTNDSVAAVDTTGWTKTSEIDNGASKTYEYSKDNSSITLTVDDNVNNTGL